MPAVLDAGLTVEAIQTVLSANLATKFDTLDTEYADNITLNDIAHYYRALMARYDDYPTIVIFTDGNEPDEQGGSFYLRHQVIEIRVLEISNEAVDSLLPPEVMIKRLERMCRGINEVLMENRGSLSISNVDDVGITAIVGPEFLDFVQVDTGPTGRSASIAVTVTAK